MRSIIFGVLGGLLWQGASAQTQCDAPSPDCAVVGDWSISVSVGAGIRSNPLRESRDIPLVALPHISYYGERFFLDSLDFGIWLHESDRQTLSLIATPGYDRVFFFRHDLQNLVGFPGIGDIKLRDAQSHRHTSYLAGPEWIFRYGRIVGQLNALREVTGQYDGYEARAAVSTSLLQSKASLIASAGFTWKSAELVNYYYGVKNLYEAGAMLNPFLKLTYDLPLSDRCSFSAFAHYESLGDGIRNSPIVSEDRVLTVFSGFVFSIL